MYENVAFLKRRLDRRRVDDSAANGVGRLSCRHYLKSANVVRVIAAAADAALEMTGDARLGIVDRANAVPAVGEGVVRLPLMLEDVFAGLLGGSHGPGANQDRYAGQKDPGHSQCHSHDCPEADVQPWIG